MKIWIAATLIGVAATAPAAARTDQLPVGICVNMGNHLETDPEGKWGRVIADDDFQIIADAGFQTVRIPVRWDTRTAKSAPYTIDPAFMARVQHVVTNARAAGLNVILNSHHYHPLHENPAGERDRLAAIWRQVAEAFQSAPDAGLWFEIDNEPMGKLTHANLLETLSPALAAIRASNPTRAVIIGGENWSGIDTLATLPLPEDPNIVPTFHYYEPFAFTHQGASWVDNPPPLGRTYGGAEDAARLKADVAKVQAYIARTGKTPFIGEFGAHSTVPSAARVQYQKAVRGAFQPLGVGLCAWAFTNTFPLYNGQQKSWLPGMLDAMGLEEK